MKPLTKITPDNTIIFVALESELPATHLPEWRIVYTGVGKVNAAIEGIKNYHIYQPFIAINYGTAGTLNQAISGLVEVGQCYERDMDVRPLGFAIGQTPFEDAIGLSFGYEGVTCSSGDNFVTDTPELNSDIVDMEAYALAKVAKKVGCDFRCFKYISDSADGEAAADWQENQRRGAKHFVDHFLRVVVGGDTRT